MTPKPPPVPWTELRVIREKDGFSLRQLAEISGYTANYLSLCENGERRPSEETIKTLAEVLRVPFSMLKPHGPHDLDPVEFSAMVDKLGRPAVDLSAIEAPTPPKHGRRGRRRPQAEQDTDSERAA
jgi:transcriptional regulator with XRE-family HTH domain